MLRGLRTFPLLDGFRGRPPAELGAIEDVVLRVAALAAAHAEVAELDCNPGGGSYGAVVVDARLRLEPPLPTAPYAAVERPYNHDAPATDPLHAARPQHTQALTRAVSPTMLSLCPLTAPIL